MPTNDIITAITQLQLPFRGLDSLPASKGKLYDPLRHIWNATADLFYCNFVPLLNHVFSEFTEPRDRTKDIDQSHYDSALQTLASGKGRVRFPGAKASTALAQDTEGQGLGLQGENECDISTITCCCHAQNEKTPVEIEQDALACFFHCTIIGYVLHIAVQVEKSGKCHSAARSALPPLTNSRSLSVVASNTTQDPFNLPFHPEEELLSLLSRSRIRSTNSFEICLPNLRFFCRIPGRRLYSKLG